MKQCLEITPDTVLNEIPDELKSLLPAIESKINSMAKQFGIKVGLRTSTNCIIIPCVIRTMRL